MSFKKIRGQDRQIEILTSSIKRGTVSHAYLFTGIPGIGKRATAIAMAKALNCETGSGDFCDGCISCKKIEHRTHPDIHWVEPEGDYIKIDPNSVRNKEVSYQAGDYSKAKEILGWEPKVKFKELIKIMVDADYNNLIREKNYAKE